MISLVWASVFSFLAVAPTQDVPSDLDALLPAEMAGWTRTEACRSYDANDLFTYIDGAAEVYRSFHVKKVLACRYAKSGGPDIVADLYDMGRSEDAYGLYHHEVREHSDTTIGQESDIGANSVVFWKGTCFVSIVAMDATPEAKEAVLGLARSAAAAIARNGAIPDLLDRIPQKGLIKNQTFYFHDSICLNTHYLIEGDNPLELSADTEGVVACYAIPEMSPEGPPAVLVTVRYPSVARARQARASYAKAFLEASDGQAKAKQPNGKWTAVRVAKNEMACVFDAPSSAAADALLEPMPPAPLQKPCPDEHNRK